MIFLPVARTLRHACGDAYGLATAGAPATIRAQR